ncbi:MAG: hypothetical protein ACJ8AW_20175, partial [Rhodopila sp.]
SILPGTAPDLRLSRVSVSIRRAKTVPWKLQDTENGVKNRKQAGNKRTERKGRTDAACRYKARVFRGKDNDQGQKKYRRENQ